MQGFWLEGFVLPKSSKSRSLISDFSFQVLAQLNILGEHLSNSIHGGKQLSFIIQPVKFIIIIIFHFLLYVAKGLSSLIVRERRNDSNQFCYPGQADLNTRHVVTPRVTRATFPFNSRFTEQAHRHRLQSPALHSSLAR